MHVWEGWRALLAYRDTAVAAGSRVMGWKVAWNHESAQRRFGVPGPAVGFLFDDRLHAPGQPLSLDGAVFPGVEVEVAARLGADGSVVQVAPAVEVIDVSTAPDDPIAALGANVWHRCAVIGEWQPVPTGFVVPDIGWMAETVASFGERLREGDIVLTGSLDPRVQWVKAGDVVEAEVPGLGVCKVEFN